MQGRCAPVAEGEGEGCPRGEHDGGGGVCVPVGLCVSGFDRFYADDDGDGVGAGPLLPDCLPLPPPPGFSATSGDCAPDDARAFASASYYADVDGDGYTTAEPVPVCNDGSVPERHYTSPKRAPIVVALPRVAVGDSTDNDDWQGPHDADRIDGDVANVDLDPLTESDALDLADFLCAAPADVRAALDVQGLEVRLAGAFVSSSSQQEISAQVTLLDDGVGVATRQRFDVWPFALATAATLSFGGPNDDWDGALASLDPCAPTFGVRTTLTPVTFGGRANLDAVVVLLYAAGDCDDGDADVATPATVFADLDRDLWGSGAATRACLSVEQALARALRDGDCDDREPRAFPFQNGAFDTPAVGGGFDFDCNGVEEAVPTSSAASCAEATPGNCVVSQTEQISGTCGEEIDVKECGPALLPCQPTSTPTVERARCR